MSGKITVSETSTQPAETEVCFELTTDQVKEACVEFARKRGIRIKPDAKLSFGSLLCGNMNLHIRAKITGTESPIEEVKE